MIKSEKKFNYQIILVLHGPSVNSLRMNGNKTDLKLSNKIGGGELFPHFEFFLFCFIGHAFKLRSKMRPTTNRKYLYKLFI